MRRALPDGYELDDDPARVDVDVVHRFLSTESYWALGSPRERVVAKIAGSQRVVGLYHAGGLVGFARVLTDETVFAYLADVFVLSKHRGKGLGVELLRETIDNGPYADLSWSLVTDDAQGLYEKLGFRAIAAPTTAMARPMRR
jgi:ribosomal protein S18 acetylase RimI-like enzyme